MTKVARQNEMPRTWFRSERVFLEGDQQWYFQTREGVDVGPYDSQFEAEIEAGLLKELIREVEGERSIMRVIHDFVAESHSMGRPLKPRYHGEELHQSVTA